MISPTTKAPTLDEVRQLVAEILELEPDVVSDDSHLIDEHEADSLLLIEIVARLEKLYKITIEQQDVAAMTTVHDIHKLVLDHLRQETSAT